MAASHPPDAGSTRPGLMMLASAAMALLLANSPLAGVYSQLVGWPTTVGIDPLSLQKPLVLWVNEALMAMFFLLIGIEIKRDIVYGSLRSWRQASLPVFAALGGVVVPALIFLSLVGSAESARAGWAIPCATDIAFSLVVLRLVAPHLPPALPLFLTAVAVIDDLAAILIIAFFYAGNLSPSMMLAALVPLLVLLVLNRRGVQQPWPYLLAGAVLWLCVLKSGVHATMAGVITAMAMPTAATGGTAQRVEHSVKPWVDYLVLPLFAFFNAGVALRAATIAGEGFEVAFAVSVALLVGKTIGVLSGVALGRWLLGSSLPSGAGWREMAGIAALAGIGFTMSLFVASLAYETASPVLFDAAKLGTIIGSALAALLGAVLLRRRAATA